MFIVPHFFVGIAAIMCPKVQSTTKTMGVHITTIVYLRIVVTQIGSTIILVGAEPQGVAVHE